MEKHIEEILNAIKNIRISDHITYITYPVVKDKRLLLKALDSVYLAIIGLINAILHYEYITKKINLSSHPKENFQTFMNESSKRINLGQEELNTIIELLTLAERHKTSPMEFMRKDKVVIMSDNLRATFIDTDKIKRYLNLAKRLVEKAKIYTNSE